MLGALVGLVVRQFRSRTSLIAENELLRQQLAAAKSRLQRKRVMFTGSQRLTIALLTRRTASWRATVTLVRPATVLRWHREGFRLLWRWRSRTHGRRPTSYATLIREMAAQNPRWGAQAQNPGLEAHCPAVHEEAGPRRRPTLEILSSTTTLPGLVTSCRPST